jgi:hypothetical protein
MFNVSLINKFVKDELECVYKDFLHYIFSKNEYDSFIEGYNGGKAIVRFNALLIKKSVLYYTIQIAESTYYDLSENKSKVFYGTHPSGIVDTFITEYTIYLNAYNEHITNIEKSNMSREKYNEMFNYYNKIPLKIVDNVDDTYIGGVDNCIKCCLNVFVCKCKKYEYCFDSTRFTKKQNETFTQLNKDYIYELEFKALLMSQMPSNYSETLKRENIGRHEYIVKYDYTDFVIWEANGTDYINMIAVAGLVNYYDINDNIIHLSKNVSRGLLIPFIIIPTENSYKLIDDLLKNPNAIPIFKTICLPVSRALYYLQKAIIPTNLFNVNNTNLYKCLCKEINNNIKCNYNLPNEEDIIKLFADECDITKSKRKKRKKPTKTPTIVPIIDISNTTSDEIVEVDTPLIVQNDEIDSINNTDSTDDEPDEIIPIPININVVVKYNKLPFTIIFYKYEYIAYAEQDLIYLMITQLYLNNNSFKTFMVDYNSIRVIQGIHTDFSGLDKTRHFNIIFYNTQLLTKTKPHHAYLNSNNEIVSITTIVNILLSQN